VVDINDVLLNVLGALIGLGIKRAVEAITAVCGSGL